MILLMEDVAGQVSALDNRMQRIETNGSINLSDDEWRERDTTRRTIKGAVPKGTPVGNSPERNDSKATVTSISSSPAIMSLINKEPSNTRPSNGGDAVDTQTLTTAADAGWLSAQEKNGVCSQDVDWIWTEDDTRMFCGLIPILHERHPVRLVFEMATYVLVFFSIGLIIAKSYSEDDPDSEFMDISQACLAGWFTAEYAVRWSAVRPHKSIPRPYSFREFWDAKARHTVSFMPMIDLLSFLPFYVELILESQGQGDSLPSGALGVLRVVRVLRIFKLTRNNQTIADFFIAVNRIRKDLLVFLCVLIAMIVVFAAAIFYAERNGPFGDQFNNIPICMWWTVITFSSVGYGDMFPGTDAGYVVGALAAITGVLLMNVPIAFILISFDEVYSLRKERENSMSAVVDKIFAWIDRNKRNDEVAELALRRQIVQTLESTKKRGRGLTVKKLMTLVRQKRKRELWRQRKQRQKEKTNLLEALMDPFRRGELLNHSVEADARYAEDKEKTLVEKFAHRWMEKALGKKRDGKAKSSNRGAKSNQIHPLRTVVQSRASMSVPTP